MTNCKNKRNWNNTKYFHSHNELMAHKFNFWPYGNIHFIGQVRDKQDKDLFEDAD